MTSVRSFTPYLIVHDGAAAISFYASVFGAREIARYTEGSGRIGHAELSFAGHLLNLAEEHPEYDMRSPRTVGRVVGGISVQVDDADAVVAAAEKAGAKVLQPVKDEFHGDRAGRIEDPFGHVWSVHTQKVRVPAADLTKGWIEMAPGNTASVVTPVHEVGYYTFAVPDLGRGRTFYAGVFGWEFGATSRNGATSYSHVDNVRLPLGITDDAKGASPHLYYRVDDIEAATSRVRAHGGSAEPVLESKSGKSVACRDDQGVPFSLWEPAAGF